MSYRLTSSNSQVFFLLLITFPRLCCPYNELKIYVILSMDYRLCWSLNKFQRILPRSTNGSFFTELLLISWNIQFLSSLSLPITKCWPSCKISSGNLFTLHDCYRDFSFFFLLLSFLNIYEALDVTANDPWPCRSSLFMVGLLKTASRELCGL